MRTTTRRGANHPLHLILTLITCGMWAPVWIVVAAVGRRTTVTETGAYAPPRPLQGAYRCPGCWYAGRPNHIPGACPGGY